MKRFSSRTSTLALSVGVLILLLLQLRFRLTQVNSNHRPFNSPTNASDAEKNGFTSAMNDLGPEEESASVIDKSEASSQWPEMVEKAVVMARLDSENTSWVSTELPEYVPSALLCKPVHVPMFFGLIGHSWQPAIYSVESPSPPYVVPTNKGKEAMAYLTYIIDHYDHLPSIIAFIHAHRDGYPRAWHTDMGGYSNVESLKRLRLKYVSEAGYANLRCNGAPRCPDQVQPFRKPPENDQEEHMRAVWPALFGEDIEVPTKLAAACCSQFAVTGDQVRNRTREEYVKYRKWLLETELNDEVSGRVFEFLWHVIMGREAVQ